MGRTDGRSYYASKTLVGGLDVNRRTIYFGSKYEEGREVAVFNRSMKDWTPRHAAELNACLKALNDLND